MAEEAPYDIEELRARFPWVGVLDIDEERLSSSYREIMAEARVDREIVEAIDSVRSSR